MTSFPALDSISRSVAFLVLAFQLAACKTQNYQEASQVQSANQVDVVLAHCFAPQGNGGHWASLLGWISEEINLRVSEGKALESEGKSVGIYLGCYTAGSSGSVGGAVLSAILANKSLFPSKNSQSIFTLSEAELVVRAINYTALASDLNFREIVRFFGQAIQSNIVAEFAKRKIIPNQEPTWWDGATVKADHIFTDFTTSVHLASTMTKELLFEPVASYLTPEENEEYAQLKVKYLTDTPRFNSISDIPKSTTSRGKILASAYAKQSQAIGRNADNFVAKQFQLNEYAKRHAVNLGPNGPDYILKRTLEKPLEDGVCSILLGLLAKNKEKLAEVPSYPEMNPIVFCNKKTIERILNSDLYRSHIENSHPFASKYIFAVVPNIRGSIYPSVREPMLMKTLTSPFGSGELEVSQFYFPAWDFEKNGKFTFDFMDAKNVSISEESFVPYLGVGGGFPDRRISAWPASYFYADVLKGDLSRLGRNVKVTFGLYGRDNGRATEAFHKMVVRKVFSRSPAEGQTNLNNWMAFMDSWCDTMGDHLEKIHQAKIENITVDWEMSKIPAAQTPGGLSKLLLVKSINAVRTQAGDKLKSHEVSFDPVVESNHVPLLNTPNTCKETPFH
jgi:hypothetical protein